MLFVAPPVACVAQTEPLKNVIVCLSPAAHTCVESTALTSLSLLTVFEAWRLHTEPLKKSMTPGVPAPELSPAAQTWVLSRPCTPLKPRDVLDVCVAHVD